MRRGKPSDTALAETYGVSRQTIHRWRKQSVDVYDPEAVKEGIIHSYRVDCLMYQRVMNRAEDVRELVAAFEAKV